MSLPGSGGISGAGGADVPTNRGGAPGTQAGGGTSGRPDGGLDGGFDGAGADAPSSADGSLPPSTAPAFLKYCASANITSEVRVGNVRLAAAPYSCSTTCAQMAPGEAVPYLRINQAEIDFAPIRLQPGQSHALVMSVSHGLELVALGPGQASCNLPYPNVLERFPARRPLAIEAAPRPDDVTVAKPVGWQQAAPAADGELVFRPTGPSGGLTELRYLPIEDMPLATAPAASVLLQQFVARRGGTLLENIVTFDGYATALAEFPRAGATRFQRWGLVRYPYGTTAQIFAAILSAATADDIPKDDAAYYVKTFAYSLSEPNELKPADVAGKWRAFGSVVGSDSFNGQGVWTGSISSGEGLEITLSSNGTYQMFQFAAADCSSLSPCVVEGFYGAWETGRFVVAHGLMTFLRESCISRFYNKSNVLQRAYLCPTDSSAMAASVAIVDNGQLSLRGIALLPLPPGGRYAHKTFNRIP
ncbi:MAG TPA: hypothetical protein VGF45_11565 [Polyangia bacterium]